LEERLAQQNALLDRAAELLKSGGRIAYVTCSVLGEENGAQVRNFMARRPDFTLIPPREVAAAVLGELAESFCAAALLSAEGLLMTPQRTDTDGFFVALMRAPG
jgi:16S rRNA (cytosine967-C5)-methyltransferase